ncbi:MAG: LCP family protein [Actinobacteria bacterium]|nr:LCP family protein [Actinomycetota bacterium]
MGTDVVPSRAARGPVMERAGPRVPSDDLEAHISEPAQDPPQPGEPAGSSHAGRRWRRAWIVAGVVLLVAVVALAGTAGVLVWYGERSIGRVSVSDLVGFGGTRGSGGGNRGGTASAEVAETLNVLVVGSDNRQSLTTRQRRILRTGPASGTRTDTIILARIDTSTDRVAMLSFPRDLLVTLCDGSQGRINSAFEIGKMTGRGGPTCLVQTVRRLTGVPINHFVEVDLAGFVNVVEAVGGVRMYLDEPLYDEDAGLDLPKGCVTLGPVDSVAFVRARHLDSDFGRIARQQRFLKELLDEVVSVDTLTNVPQLFRLVNAVGESVETDEDVTLDKMRRIAFSLRDVSPKRVVAVTVPVASADYYGAAYVVPVDSQAEALFDAFRTGEIFPEPEREEASRPTVPAGRVPAVTVLNGAGQSGLASRASARLRQRGLKVAAVGDNARFGRTRTVVRYPSERLHRAANTVAAALPEATVERAPGQPLTVILGTDFTGDPLRKPKKEDYAGARPTGRDC